MILIIYSLDTVALVGGQISTVAGLLTPVIISVIALNAKNKFKRYDTKLDTLDLKVDKVLAIDNVKDRLHIVVDNLLGLVDPQDSRMLKLIAVCLKVSLYFYDEITTGDISSKSIKDVDRYSNKAIQEVWYCTKCFNLYGEEGYVSLFWEPFGESAMLVKKDFLEVIKSGKNNKHKRIADIIEDYLKDQLVMIIKLRIAYNNTKLVLKNLK